MTFDDRQPEDTARWASEGGADPRGPATDVPAVPPADDDDGQPPPGQEEEPEAGTTVAEDEPAPQDIGESG